MGFVGFFVRGWGGVGGIVGGEWTMGAEMCMHAG